MFADIAGFTALTEAHGDEEAADLVDKFCRAVAAQLPACGGTKVKTIGDAVMLRVPDPGDAIQLGLRIAHDIMRGHGAPSVRVGMHHGPAVERDGDYFGASVNLAARVSAEAAASEVLMTADTAARAPSIDGIAYTSRGRRQLRNVREPVELVAAVRQGLAGADALAVDPVCQMVVDPEHSAGRLTYEGTDYYFCAFTCAGAFARNPDRYANAAGGA